MSTPSWVAILAGALILGWTVQYAPYIGKPLAIIVVILLLMTAISKIRR